jgi:tRNA A37 threonylcarbamoyladenosine biosynthesis protein TsaE
MNTFAIEIIQIMHMDVYKIKTDDSVGSDKDFFNGVNGQLFEPQLDL